MTDKRVLTIQDISCVGQCSLTVALPILSACGIETVILPSAVLSTHTGGFGKPVFCDLTDKLSEISEHWIAQGIKFECLYTGYLGNVRQIAFVKELVKKLWNPDEGEAKGIIIVDPAMADHGRLYSGFDWTFVSEMSGLCKIADIILPNITEAAFLTGKQCREEAQDEAYILELLEALAALGAKKIVLKGITYKKGMLGIAVYDCGSCMGFSKQKVRFYFTERMAKNSHGTGDCFAAAFTGAIIQGRTVEQAVTVAAEFVLECLRKTADDPSHWYGVKFEKALPMLVKELNV